MGVERFRRDLGRHRRVALDTSIFIYHLEANPKYTVLTDYVFSSLDSHTFSAVTSIITMTELLVKPYREFDTDSANRCYGLLSTYPNLDWICPTLETADVAAEIRAIHRLRTPDAVQAATAARANATAMLTNDPVFRRLTNMEVLVLDDFV